MVIYRDYNSGDEKNILSLYNSVFKTTRDEEYWKWQYNKYPWGKPIICLGEDNDRIIGQTTLLPTKINYQGSYIEGGYSIDTMVDKDYRRRGIFATLANKSYEKGKEQGIKFRYGFPVFGALIGLTDKLGATLVDEIPVFIRVYRLDKYLASKIGNKTLAKIISVPSLAFTRFMYKEKRIRPKDNYIIKEVNSFNEDFDNLWDKLKDSFSLMTPRTSAYLNWRIKDHPTIKYNTFVAYLGEELLGYIIVRVESKTVNGKLTLKVGHIMDMLATNDNVLGSIYFKVKEFLKSENIDFILSWAGDSMQYRNLLVDLGFYKTRTNIPFVVKELTGDKDLEEIITKERNWNVMPIESDIY